MIVEIIPNLWMSNINIVKYKHYYKFDYVINCLKNLHFLEKNNNFKLSTELKIDKIYNYLDELTDYIYKKINLNKKILIICEDCTQKSPTIICTYLIKFGKININNSIKYFKTKYENIFLNDIYYNDVLLKFELKFLSM